MILDPEWFTMSPRCIYVLNSSNSDYMFSSIARPSLAGHFGQMTFTSPHAILLVWTSSYVKDYCNCAPLVPVPSLCATNPTDSQELPIPEPWNSISMEDRETPSIFWLHLNSSLLIISQSSHSSFWLRPSTTSTCTTLHSTCFFQAQCSNHFTSDCGMEFVSHFFWSLNCMDMKLHFTSDSSWRWWQMNKLIRLWNSTSESIATTNKTIVELLPLAEFIYNNTRVPLLALHLLAQEDYHMNLTVIRAWPCICALSWLVTDLRATLQLRNTLPMLNVQYQTSTDSWWLLAPEFKIAKPHFMSRLNTPYDSTFQETIW